MSEENSCVVLVTGGYDHTIKFWDPLTGLGSKTFQHTESHINCLSASNDKKYLAVGGNPALRIYDIPSPKASILHSFEGHGSNVTSAGFQRDNKWLFTGSEDKSIRIWDMRARKCQREIAEQSAVNCVVLHPNQGELISCSQNGSLKIWDLSANSCVHELIPEEDVPMKSISIASDGSLLVAVNNKGNCYVWTHLGANNESASDWTPVTKIAAHSTYITSCLLSPDCQILATTSADTTTKLWNISKNFSPNRTLEGHQKWVWDCAFSADSNYLVTVSSDGTARLWNVATGETLRQYSGHSKPVVAVALNDLPT